MALTFCAAGIAPGHAQEAAAARAPLQAQGLGLARDPALLPRTGRRSSPDPYMALIRASQQAIGLTSPEQQKQTIPGIGTSLPSGMARHAPRRRLGQDPSAVQDPAAISLGCHGTGLAKRATQGSDALRTADLGAELANGLLPGAMNLQRLPGLAAPTLETLGNVGEGCR
ncbi:hypothetical protein [Pseudoxanthomonas winnipegensis]|uniref:Uncharacterized protein n=1 Tax=Pseudoxanthomonas winnipegensis TaxID=2480810 RepID=A0A4Q8M4E7_9GAMM|nr:hypothetical protein [Pseudoxanthomonas winnipegensis]TAA44608.1 hypothetical protein EA655_06660 [Pseudoxanthomonas winnipegensis]